MYKKRYLTVNVVNRGRSQNRFPIQPFFSNFEKVSNEGRFDLKLSKKMENDLFPERNLI